MLGLGRRILGINQLRRQLNPDSYCPAQNGCRAKDLLLETLREGEKLRTSIRTIALTLMLTAVAAVQARTYSGKVVGVTDGDTITVLDSAKRQHAVRLAGIDAPEKKQAYGQRARQSLSDMLFQKVVTIDTHKNDKYGREIGKVLLDGRD